MITVDGRMSVDQGDELHQIEADFVVAYGQGEHLIEWLERYPEHALALTDLAIALDLEAQHLLSAPSDERLSAAARALTHARNQVFGTPPTPSSPGLVARARSLGYTVPQLARQLRLGGDILFKFNHGMIQPDTVPRRLLKQLAAALEWSIDGLPACLTGPRPAPAHYYGDTAPQRGNEQSFAEALVDSDATSDEDRAAWLAVLREEGHIA